MVRNQNIPKSETLQIACQARQRLGRCWQQVLDARSTQTQRELEKGGHGSVNIHRVRTRQRTRHESYGIPETATRHWLVRNTARRQRHDAKQWSGNRTEVSGWSLHTCLPSLWVLATIFLPQTLFVSVTMSRCCHSRLTIGSSCVEVAANYNNIISHSSNYVNNCLILSNIKITSNSSVTVLKICQFHK